jgi:hypothetical protein
MEYSSNSLLCFVHVPCHSLKSTIGYNILTMVPIYALLKQQTYGKIYEMIPYLLLMDKAVE